jgi:FkbM family methyltransferase
MAFSFLQFARKVRLALTPRSWYLKTRLSSGAVVYGQNREGFGGRGIYVFREDIEPEFAHFVKFFPDAPAKCVMIDVGANTGIYSVAAAKNLGERGVVISIEPFPDIFAVLYRTVQRNGFSNVRLRSFCAGARTEPATLWMNENKPHLFSLRKHDAGARALGTLVVALDDLARWEQLERLDYLKIDAEGAEADVLAGARQMLERFRPIIQAEITYHDVALQLRDYAAFQAPASGNKVFIPYEHPKFSLAEALGWQRE